MAEAPRSEPWRRTVRTWRRTARILADPLPRLAVDLTRTEEVVARLSWELPLLEVDPFAFVVDAASDSRSSHDRDARFRRKVSGEMRRTPASGTAVPPPAAQRGGRETLASAAGGSRSPAAPTRGDVVETASRTPRSSSSPPATESVIAAGTISRAPGRAEPPAGDAAGESSQTPGPLSSLSQTAPPSVQEREYAGGSSGEGRGNWAGGGAPSPRGGVGAAGRRGRGVRDWGGAAEAPGREDGEKSVLASLVDALLEPKSETFSDSDRQSSPRPRLRPTTASEKSPPSHEPRAPGRASGNAVTGSPPAAGTGRPAERVTAGTRPAAAQSLKARIGAAGETEPRPREGDTAGSPRPATAPLAGDADAVSLPVSELDARRLASLIDGVLIEDAAAPAAPVPGDAEPLPLPVSELDARRLASLINDVLVEEARRHGVDLS